MRKLILIKHAKPQVTDDLPSHEWPLSEEGRGACARLAEVVSPQDPAVILTSDEPKARETGELLGKALGRPVETVGDLHEHDRTNVPMMTTRDFISAMALFFKNRRRLVLGRETADQAARRFEQAIRGILQSRPEGNIAVVTHGTVLSLFAADHGAGDGFQLWRRLGLPSMMVFSIPDLKPLETIERIENRAI